jgi:hypothetical protein
LKYDTEFDVKLYVNGIRYWYQLVVNPEKVCSKVMYVYLSNRPTKVFTREDINGISTFHRRNGRGGHPEA